MDFEKIYIDGKWAASDSDGWIEVENPATLEKFARVPACTASDVDKAARAASRAFPAWAAKPLTERRALMQKFLEILKSNEDALVDITVKELGSPIAFTRSTQVRKQFLRVEHYIDLCDKVPFVERTPGSTVYRFPIGVVGCITPWNYPLGQVVQKVVPALLMGNTVILKPSQHTPLSSYWLADAFDKAGFPAGTFNLVTGRGAEIGDVISSHPLVSMVSFTGSTRGGVTVARRALESVKHVSLELGGKSPFVILPGAQDLMGAAKTLFNSIFLNAGQTCTAFSRVLIPEADKDKIMGAFLEAAKGYTAGDPLDPNVNIGPVASAAQFKKIRSYIAKGLEEGAKLALGKLPDEDQKGYLIEPVIFTGVKNSMSIARDEIFGPVLCVITYKDEAEALEIANDTSYGLNAGVWGPTEKALEFAKRIDSGNVYVNASPRDETAPFGGWKMSGLGREGGLWGLIEFTQQKALYDTKA